MNIDIQHSRIRLLGMPVACTSCCKSCPGSFRGNTGTFSVDMTGAASVLETTVCVHVSYSKPQKLRWLAYRFVVSALSGVRKRMGYIPDQ